MRRYQCDDSYLEEEDDGQWVEFDAASRIIEGLKEEIRFLRAEQWTRDLDAIYFACSVDADPDRMVALHKAEYDRMTERLISARLEVAHD